LRLLPFILIAATSGPVVTPGQAAVPAGGEMESVREGVAETGPQGDSAIGNGDHIRQASSLGTDAPGAGPMWWTLAVIAMIAGYVAYRLAAQRDPGPDHRPRPDDALQDVRTHLEEISSLTEKALQAGDGARVQDCLHGISHSVSALRRILQCTEPGSAAARAAGHGSADAAPPGAAATPRHPFVAGSGDLAQAVPAKAHGGRQGGAPAAVDRDAGLRWADGNAGLYEKLVEEFLRVYREKLALLTPEEAEARPDEIEKLAHGLKSSAALVGARQLARAAADLDSSIKGSGGIDSSALKELRLALAAVLLELQDSPAAVPGAGSRGACGASPGEEGHCSVLVVDDDPYNRMLISSFLQPEYGVYFAEGGDEALLLARRQPDLDLILLDVVMGEMDGFEVCRRLKADPATRHIPVVFITGRTEAVDEQLGLDLGAVDYIRKPFQRSVLKARVRNHIALKRHGDALEALSGIDALTGIANRRRFDEVLEREWNSALRRRLPLALMMIDIDCFKAFNDRYGHDLGDECLRRVGQTLGELCRRKTDLVARYGGEEFCWVLPDTGLAGAGRKAVELLEAIRALDIPHDASDVARYVTASIGVWSEVPDTSTDMRAFFKQADERLYRAKRQGRNRVVAG
jgi:diguanylate cyclase (GGDEF)-like protein